jgi:UDP-N-acetylmuramoylalanine-D-glutamate ligase
MTVEGGVALLSPGCASFDEFEDFERRGVAFKGFVRECFRREERTGL